MGAEGGDVVVLDPADGEVLAMTSRWRDPRTTASTALAEPYEPGSTIKPLIAAALLERKKARETDVVNTFGGQMTINGRTITDEHKGERFSLADDDVVAVFPPSGSLGDHADVLSHIILRRSTLPWERTAVRGDAA